MKVALKIFIGLVIFSAIIINITTSIPNPDVYIIFWIAVILLVIGLIGVLICGGGKIILDILEKIL